MLTNNLFPLAYADVMGSGSRNTIGMRSSDYSALSKHAAGWLPNKYVVNLDPTGAGILAGSRQSATFSMAAMDRDYTIGDRAGALSLLPANTALVARSAVPKRAYLEDQGAQQFVYFFNRAQTDSGGFGTVFNRPKAGITSAGIFIAEFSFKVSGTYDWKGGYTWGVASAPVLHCYRDHATCTSQWQIGSYDAFIFDPNGIKLLVQVGGSKRIIAGSDATLDQDSALDVTIAYLDDTATITDANIPPRTYVPSALVTASTTLAYTQSLISPVSVFKVVSSTAAYVRAEVCCVASCDVTELGVSAFLGTFPAAHAYYGGNTGVTGHVNWPGDITDVTGSEFGGGGISCAKEWWHHPPPLLPFHSRGCAWRDVRLHCLLGRCECGRMGGRRLAWPRAGHVPIWDRRFHLWCCPNYTLVQLLRGGLIQKQRRLYALPVR